MLGCFGLPLAESGPGLLALQILHRGMGKIHYFDGSVPYSSYFDETSTFKVFADNASRSFS